MHDGGDDDVHGVHDDDVHDDDGDDDVRGWSH
jgi:hypothetical protein